MKINHLLPDISVWSEDNKIVRHFIDKNKKDIEDTIRNLFFNFCEQYHPYLNAKNPLNQTFVNKSTSTINNLSNHNKNNVSSGLGILNDSWTSIIDYLEKLKLSNAIVGSNYSYELSKEIFCLPEIGDIEFVGIEILGLQYLVKEKRIIGVPINHGEYPIKIRIKRTDWELRKPFIEKTLTLIINPDPKSLWNNLPTPKDIEYYKPDEDKQFLKVKSINSDSLKDMVAASQRGRSHAHEAKARDDDFQLFYDENNKWYILAVADGAGSSKYSRKGSQIATQVAVEVCKTQISEHNEEFCKLIKSFSEDKSDENRKKFGDYLYTIVGSSIFKAYKAIESEAKTAVKPVKDYSTTLIFSICKKFSFGWFVGAFWVGDGGIGIYNKDKQFLKVLGESDGGEFAGQTRFLTMPEITSPTELYRRLRFDIVDDFTALILMSDGITDPKFETDANLTRIEKWNELWRDLSNEVDFLDDNEASAEQLLKWLDFWSPGNHDDRTIAIMY
jgi:serine/threonine protein phosphatase PrpC